MILSLSAGHNPVAKGATGNYNGRTIEEYDITEVITTNVISGLTTEGVKTNRIPPLGLGKKIALVNSAGSQMAIEFHLNEEEVPEEVRGPWGIYWGWDEKFSYKGRLWADSIRSEIAKVIGVPGRIMTTQELGRKLAWVHATWCPAIIIECFFLSSPKDLEWYFGDPLHPDLLTGAIVSGIKNAITV